MATIQTRRANDGRTRYRAMVRLKGYPPESATFKRRTDAKRWATQTEAALREGRYFPASEASRHTLAEAIARYLAEVMPRKRTSTSRVQIPQLEWWAEQIGAYTLDKVTTPLLIEQRTALLQGDRSQGTANRYMAAVGHVLSTCVREWAWTDASPMQRIKPLPESRGRTRVLTEDERDRLLVACRESTRRELYPVVLLALSTGARLGELLGLQWRDVDLKRRTITIQETKNSDPRTLPVFGFALDELRALSKRRGTSEAPLSPLVFPDATGQKPIRLRFHWDRACKQAGLSDFTFHDLRHCCGTWLSKCGASAPQIAAILGHRQWSMSRRYTHYNTEHSADLLKQMVETFIT